MKHYDIILSKGLKITLKSGFLFNSIIFNDNEENIILSIIEHETGWYEVTYPTKDNTFIKFECRDYEISKI